MIPAEDWKWYGSPAHFVGRADCTFHLATEVGEYLVSTVGDYWPTGGAVESQAQEIGSGRLYETMVFRFKDRCPCGCRMPLAEGNPLDAVGCNDSDTANKTHLNLCRKYANA